MNNGHFKILHAEDGGWHWKVTGPKGNELGGWTKGPKKNAERSAGRALQRMRDMNKGKLDNTFRISNTEA